MQPLRQQPRKQELELQIFAVDIIHEPIPKQFLTTADKRLQKENRSNSTIFFSEFWVEFLVPLFFFATLASHSPYPAPRYQVWIVFDPADQYLRLYNQAALRPALARFAQLR
jgi:hypothetical protein